MSNPFYYTQDRSNQTKNGKNTLNGFYSRSTPRDGMMVPTHGHMTRPYCKYKAEKQDFEAK